MTESFSNQQNEFALQFIENQGRVYAYIAILLPNRADAEDVLQRTSLIMWQKWAQFNPSHGFVPWARGIALNEVRNFLRRSDRKNVHLSESLVEILAEETVDDDHDLRKEALDHCLGRLKRRQRELLEQCYLGPAGVEAAAASFGATTAAIYMRLHRIRKILVECIDRRIASSFQA